MSVQFGLKKHSGYCTHLRRQDAPRWITDVTAPLVAQRPYHDTGVITVAQHHVVDVL
jgi:hypothetical protein